MIPNIGNLLLIGARILYKIYHAVLIYHILTVLVCVSLKHLCLNAKKRPHNQMQGLIKMNESKDYFTNTFDFTLFKLTI